MLILHLSDIHFCYPACVSDSDPDEPFRTRLLQDARERVGTRIDRRHPSRGRHRIRGRSGGVCRGALCASAEGRGNGRRIIDCAGRLRGCLLRALRFPVPRQELVDPPGGVIGQARQHVGEPGLRVDVVELGGLDQRVDRGGAATAGLKGLSPMSASNLRAATRSGESNPSANQL